MKAMAGKFGAILAAAAALTLTGAAQAATPWEVFGDAEVVRSGKNDWVIALTSDVEADEPFAGVSFTPNKSLTFAGITRLSADNLLAEGTFGGGSPRFQINIGDEDGNFVGNVFVYLGTPPQFDDEPEGWQSTGNLIGTRTCGSTRRSSGGDFYDDYAGALALVGDAQVLGVQLVVDGEWATEDGVQTVLVDDVRVNNFKLTGKNFDKK